MSNPPVFFWVYLDFFLFPLRSIFVFFQLDFFTITGFGDDGSGADGRVKSAGFYLGLFGFFLFPLRSIFGLFKVDCAR